MARYTGGEKVGGGYYWNTRSWEVEVVSNEGGKLKGDAGTSYVKVPFPALFVIVPLLGALFLMFLPFIGFALLAYAIVKKVTGGVKQGATELAATVQPGSFAAGSELRQWIVPPYPMATWPKASTAVTVRVKGMPAKVEAGALRTKAVALAW